MTAAAWLLRGALVAAAFLLTGCAGQYFRPTGPPPAAARPTLATLQQKELWSGVIFNGAKVGFSRLLIENLPEGGLHRLESEAVIRLRLLGFEKHIRMQAEDIVRDDLTLARFSYRYHIDGSELGLAGEVSGSRMAFDLESGKKPSRQELALEGPIYPASALNLFPVLAGLEIGREHRFTVFSGELQKAVEVSQRVQAYEQSSLFEGNAFKVTTELLGLATTSWIDAAGRPLFELGLHGVMISALEEEPAAKQYLAAAALNKDEVILDWSIVRADRPIPGARAARRLSVALEGASRMPPSDDRQRCASTAGVSICDIDSGRRASSEPSELSAALRPSVTVPSSDPAIRRLASEITATTPARPAEQIGAILGWLEKNIRKEPADVFSALDVLDMRRAECQGHAYLYAALARASGIATRVANGLVYSPQHEGFLFHTWAESAVDGRWQAIDPTFGQEEADATHLALVYGEALGDLVPLLDWVGKARATVLGIAAH